MTKIYNKKKFAFGLFCLILLLINLLVHKGTFDFSEVILFVALLLFGICSILRSTSRRLSQEDLIEEQDERNRLVNLKSKSRAFSILQWTSFGLMILSLIGGKIYGKDGILGAGIGFGCVFSLALFIEIICWIYYDSRE